MATASANALANQGAVLLQSGDTAGAIPLLDAAIASDAGCARAFAMRGRARHRLGRDRLAIEDLNEAIRLEPAEPRWFAWRALVRLAQWEFAEALADADAAIHRAPQTWEHHLIRGHARYHLRDADAGSDYQRAFELDPIAMPKRLVDELAAEVMRNAATVLRACEAHLRTHPRDFQSFARRGVTRLLMGDDAAAEQDFATCRELDESGIPRLERYIEEAKRKRATMPVSGSMYSHS